MWHELMQSTGWAKIPVKSSVVPHAVILMLLMAEKCIFVIQQYWQKAVCEADLAIYGQVFSVSGWCMNATFCTDKKWITAVRLVFPNKALF